MRKLHLLFCFTFAFSFVISSREVDYNLIADCNVKDLLVESMKTTLELDKWKEKIDFNVESVKIDLIEEIKSFKAELRKEADAEVQLMKLEKDELLQMIRNMEIEMESLKTSAKECVSKANFESFVDEVNDKFSSTKEGIESKINELQEINQDLSSRMEDIESDINGVKNRTVEISSKVLNEDSSMNDISSLKLDLDNLKKSDAINFNSCSDYLQRGINTTGYYYMYVNGGSNLESIFCKFDVLDFETCTDYYNANNLTESGRHLVYLNARPYEVYCDFSNGQGITRFDHDKMNEEVITNCEMEDCFNLEITYKESLDLIDLIKERSSNCEQKLEFNCFFSQLTSLGSWTDRHGVKSSYFSGESGENVCHCGQASPNECFQLPHLTENKCNCDARDPVNRNDIGFLTNKAALPLMKFSYGFMTSALQNASVTIGPLECKKDCHCEEVGSFDGKTCSEVGQCKCKAGFEGKTCDRCRRGFFPYPQCNNQIRLSGGTNAAEGFVEIKYVSYSSLWKGVCDDMANNKKKNNADVICKMAGYPLGSKTYHVESKPFGSGDGFLIDQLSCSGNENSVIDCGRNSLGSHDCEVGEYFGVTCLAN